MVYSTHSIDNDDGKLYPGDSVYKFDEEKNRIDFGWVAASVEEDFYEEHQEMERLQKGQIRVNWYNTIKTKNCEESKVKLMDRKITAGKYYRKLGENGTMTQKGLCVNTKQYATVLIECHCTEAVVQHVDVNRFYEDFPVHEDDAVSFGDKVGRIKSVDRLLRLKSIKCNSIVEVQADINENQIRRTHWTCDHKLEDKPYRFYELVSCIPASLIDPVWLLKSETINMEIAQEFSIESSEIHSVQAYWLLPNGDFEIGEVKGDDVKKLNFLRCSPAIVRGEQVVMMKTEPNDVLMEFSTWRKQLSNMLLPDQEEKEEKEFICDSTSEDNGKSNDDCAEHDHDSTAQGKVLSRSGFDHDCGNNNGYESLIDHTIYTVPGEVRAEVFYIETKATVIWQDGTEEQDIPSTELHVCYDSLDGHELFPGDWVALQKSGKADCGLVKSVDFADRVAKVQWKVHPLSCPCLNCEQSESLHLTEHSVYDLFKYQSLSFSGKIVYKSTTTGAMLGTIINSVPQKGCAVVQWSDGSKEYLLPGSGKFKILPYYYWNKLKFSDLPEAQESSSADDGSYDENNSEISEIAEKFEILSVDVDDNEPLVDANEGFSLLDEAPQSHKFYSSKFQPKNMEKFAEALHREYKLLEGSLPAGAWVRAYGDRPDLLSVMIRGAEDTPYEDGLFLFDIQLPADYPENPPRVHFISYSDEKLNPNLLVGGMVCLSLLGTWTKQDNKVWNTNSNLLQLIVSIQGLVLVAEPYHITPFSYKEENHIQEESRTYNEFVILILLKSMEELLNTCPQVFKATVLSHFKKNGEEMCRRIEGYCNGEGDRPEYPLLPFSKGLKLSLELHIVKFRKMLEKVCRDPEPTCT